MAKTKVLIRGKDGNAKYWGNVSGKLKIIPNEMNGMPGGYNINGRDSVILPGNFFRGPQRFIIFNEGNPNPVAFDGELPTEIVVDKDGKPVRSVSVGILCGPLIGQIARDGLYSRKTLAQWDWRIMAGIGIAVLILGYIVGQSGLKFW